MYIYTTSICAYICTVLLPLLQNDIHSYIHTLLLTTHCTPVSLLLAMAIYRDKKSPGFRKGTPTEVKIPPCYCREHTEGSTKYKVPIVPDDGYSDILQECLDIARQRQDVHGDVHDNLLCACNILDSAFDLSLDPEDVVKVLISFKLARERADHNEDNLKDLINYTAILQSLHD